MSGTGDRDKAKDYIEVKFTPDPGFTLFFDGLKGHEELGRPFLYHLDMTSGKLTGTPTKLLGATASIRLSQPDPNGGADSKRYIHGIVTRVISEGLGRGSYRYLIEIRPWFWLMTRITDCKIFQNKSPFDIVTKVFRDAGFSDFEDKRQGSSGSTVLDYCVQYRETTFDFITRLMEEYGFYYFFKHEESKHTLVIADDPNAHTALTDKIPYQFDQTERRTVNDHFWEWSSELGLVSGKFTFQDYNFTTPSADLTAKSLNSGSHTHGDYEVYEYPGPYDVAGTGKTLTDIRMQAIAAQRKTFRAGSNSRKLAPGWKFTLDKYPDKDLNKEYLITSSELSVSIGEGMSAKRETDSGDEGAALDTYRVTIHAMPGDTPFRLERLTARPVIRGPQTAKVVGPGGDEVNTDQYGRIKVKFHWDRSDTQDEERSCWIRVSQSWAGSGWGSIFIPRIGQEVVVEFLEGNPDRPLVTGVVYNANMKVPYDLPANKTQSGLKTNSSTGGSGFNEFRFEDKAGSEEVFFQAQKDFNKKVLNNETITVKQDHTTTIEQGNMKTTVSAGNHETTISSGTHKLTVSASSSSTSAATSIELKVGGSSIKISPSSIELSAAMITVKASGTLSIDGGGAATIKAGMVAIN